MMVAIERFPDFVETHPVDSRDSTRLFRLRRDWSDEVLEYELRRCFDDVNFPDIVAFLRMREPFQLLHTGKISGHFISVKWWNGAAPKVVGRYWIPDIVMEDVEEEVE